MEKQPPLKKKGATQTTKDPRMPARGSTRLKCRLKAILDWLARGAEHTCPT